MMTIVASDNAATATVLRRWPNGIVFAGNMMDCIVVRHILNGFVVVEEQRTLFAGICFGVAIGF